MDPLDQFIDETIKRAMERGYSPHVFRDMRRRHGTVKAIERLVISGEIQSGFKRLVQLNLTEWSIEAAVLKFPDRFTKNAIESAEFRIRVAKEGSM